MSNQTVIFKREVHRNQTVLSIYSPNAEPFNTIVRRLNATYSVTKKAWWLPYSKESVNQAFTIYKDHDIWVDYSAIKSKKATLKEAKTTIEPSTKKKNLKNIVWTKAQKEAMWNYAQKLELRRRSPSTFRTYGTYFKQFLAAHPNTPPEAITEEQIKKHIVTTVKKYNYATKTQNQIVNALKFYY